MREFLRQFLLYSRSERRAVITLVLLILAVIIIPGVYHFYVSKSQTTSSDTTLQTKIAQWQQGDVKRADTLTEADDKASIPDHTTGQLFYFDPNTIGVAEWLKLGLNQKQADGIEKYKSKGGQFRRPEDLRRLYSLTDADKERLIPYVRITGASVKVSNTIEINTADSAAFEALWGIGPVLSARIVKYRTQLGGFVSAEQVAEVSGMRDSVFMELRPHLTVNPALVHKISINEADYETLRRHPYIHAKIAHAIIGYRDSKGKFDNLEQVRQLKGMPADAYERIAPYLSL